MSYKHISVYARFQWLNNSVVINTLKMFLKPKPKGRKGHDKVWMFRWLIYRQLMGCSYRDLESMTGIDYSTFIKFRKRLINQFWFKNIFQILSSAIAIKFPGIRIAIPMRRHKKIERYFSRKKGVFNLGEERTRGLKNFEANCYMTSIIEILEWSCKPEIWVQLFTMHVRFYISKFFTALA